MSDAPDPAESFEDVIPAPPEADRRRGIGAIATGLRLLDVMSAGDGPMKLKEIADAAEMAPAKVHRYLASFIAGGMVTQAEKSGRYDLGPLAMRLGIAALGRFDVVERACDGLEALRDELRETCFVTAWSDRGPIIVRWEDSLRPVTVIVETGSTMPLIRSATGRAYLAFMPPARTAKLLQGELAAAGEAATAALARTEALVRETRAAGLGRVEGDFQEGIASLAVPLLDPHGAMVGAVTALGRADEFDADENGAVARRLRAFAEALAA